MSCTASGLSVERNHQIDSVCGRYLMPSKVEVALCRSDPERVRRPDRLPAEAVTRGGYGRGGPGVRSPTRPSLRMFQVGGYSSARDLPNRKPCGIVTHRKSVACRSCAA
jgi:hypothetical protein